MAPSWLTKPAPRGCQDKAPGAGLRRAIAQARLPVLIALWAPVPVAGQGLSPLLLEFGSPRSALHGLLRERPLGGSEIATQLADRLALSHRKERAPWLSYAGVSLTPTLRWDDNSNGGFRAKTIEINGMTFIVDPESRAVQEPTFGLSLGAGAGVALGLGRMLSVGARLGLRQGLAQGHGVREQAALLSLSQTFQDWHYGELTLISETSKRRLSATRTRRAALSFGKIFATTHGLQDLSGALIRAFDAGVLQTRGQIAWQGAFARTGLWRITAEFGPKHPAAHLPLQSLQASYSTWLWGQPTTLALAHLREGGGSFLGQARRDQILVVSASRRLANGVTLYGGVEQRRSSIGAFNATVLNAGLSLAGFTW